MVGNKYNFQKLTPINQADLNIYKEALEYVFENDDVKNIGISGAYSAGKSSVIETYKTLRPNIKFIHISLAYFQSATKSEEEIIELNENILEGKILNQLIHQIDPTKIPQTNFRVKRQLSSKKLWLTASLTSILAILLLYIFNFGNFVEYVKTLSPVWVKSFLEFTTMPLSALIAGVGCTTILFFLILEIIKMQFNKNVFKGISVQGNTIEIFEQSEESYFDKYLNEVLYLFENSGADVIIFEDMDRYNTNQIFQRLREINTLINNRRKNNEKPLRFFYLLRDDIFVSKERTKFFDFIMPVVPVLDGSNSYDKFIEHFKQGGIFELFDEHFLQGISLYIDDMRILKNIYNEFLIYYKRISTTEQDPNKLLAIIIYKNIFPRDFSELQLNAGFVHTLFSKKDEFIFVEKNNLRKQIDEINEAITVSENEHLKDTNEVDNLYNAQIDSLRGYYEQDKRRQLESERDARKENIKNKAFDQRNTMKLRVNTLESAVNTLQHKKLHEIINKQNANAIFKVTYTNEIGTVFDFNDIKGNDYFALIKYLIRNGYIDETYPDYMTYFYEHSLSRTDKIFLRSVTDEDAKEYTYQLKSPETVLSRLSTANFDKEEVLNFDLLAYLLEYQVGINKDKMLRMLKQVRESKNFKFISLYFESGKNIAIFVKTLNSVWSNAFRIIVVESNFTEGQKKLYALESIYHTDSSELEKMNLENTLSEFISNTKDFLNISNPDTQRIIDVFELLNIKFLDIDYEQSNKELFQAIYSHNFYVISYELVCLMLKKIYGCTDENALKHKNYTIILSKNDETLVSYISENIDDYIKSILDHCDGSIVDSEETVIHLLNEGELEVSLKINYIDNLQTSINNLQDVEDVTLWPQLLTCNLVVYSENNVLQYFFRSRNKLDKILTDFINDKGDSFKFDYDEIDNNFEEEDGSKFFNAIVKSKGLNIKTYASILEALNRRYIAFDVEGISDLKMDVLISQKIVTMTPEVLLFMREHYPQKAVAFVKQNIKAYSQEVISQENFDFDEMIEILESDVDDQYKFSLLEYTDKPIPVMSDFYSGELKVYILRNNFSEGDLPQLLKEYPILAEELQFLVEDIVVTHIDDIIENEFFLPFQLCKKLFTLPSIYNNNKLQIFAMTVDNFNQSECKECLAALGLKAYLSAFIGKRPTVPATEVHKQILDTFLKKNWISGYNFDKKNDSLYRVSGKRVLKRQTVPMELL